MTGIPHGKVTYYKNYHDNRKIELQFFDVVANFERNFSFMDENTPVWLFLSFVKNHIKNFKTKTMI